ncbi:MAG TPA: hypothetical protein PKY87_10665, partial [Terricaulis sp.]|nr:hypothetical protein [Terricaulis sp.]
KKNRTTRWLFAIHRWTGLAVGVNLLILSLTAVYLLGERIAQESGAAGEALAASSAGGGAGAGAAPP